MRQGRMVVLAGLGLYLVGLGFVGGVLAERLRFDGERTALLRRFNESVARVHTRLMELERAGVAREALAR